ncbi:hypothetical protein MILUP08_43036 [Micromonospora lupini str. Lupac 08]|uniref:Uncharacterized protein n=1 Tax=Micromonospora lupini str. Lupac 08 TaxID=1150864 RepID=I0L2Q8_9ACTN|nr:hypothetical protein MILUP08_43036 [Micromonospora lupini str. Lupac 08]
MPPSVPVDLPQQWGTRPIAPGGRWAGRGSRRRPCSVVARPGLVRGGVPGRLWRGPGWFVAASLVGCGAARARLLRGGGPARCGGGREFVARPRDRARPVGRR